MKLVQNLVEACHTTARRFARPALFLFLGGLVLGALPAPWRMQAAAALSQTRHALARSLSLPTATFAGTITGTVFLDYNANGVRDTATTTNNTGNGTVAQAADPGVANVTVTAYNAAGTVAGTTTTLSDGTYSLAAGGTGPYRIEFTNLPAGYTPSTVPASGSGPTVQFVNDGNTSGVNLGLVSATDYSQNAPNLFTNCYVSGASNGSNANEAVLISVGYNDGATVPSTNAQYDSPGTHATMLTHSQIGTTWGLAYSRSTNRLYAGSFFKRHSGFGPGADGTLNTADDPSALYVINPTLNTVVSTFSIPNATTNAHNTSNYSTDNGNTGWDAVGKTSLGGVAISDDESRLYVMNLQNRTLYALNLPSGAVAASQATPTNLPSCPSTSDARPFAVTFYRNQLYVGLVCSAESTNNRADLRAYVYTANPTTLAFSASPVLTTPLNYTRGQLHEFSNVPQSANWNPWRSTFSRLPAGSSNQQETGYPQPMLASIEFDVAGNMFLAFRDRAGDQYGYQQASNPAAPSTLLDGDGAGDLLVACGNPTSGWTMESNGQCGGNSSGGVGNNQGLGGGEFFFRDEWNSSTISPVNTLGHDEVIVGGLAQIPGFPDLLSTVYDPIPLVTDGSSDDGSFSGGLRWFNKANGVISKVARVYANNAVITYGKANGLGDLVPQRNTAPLQIGNRVWADTNANGVQDPGESGLSGVTVELWDMTSNTRVGTATSDASGQYLFGGPSNTNLSCGGTVSVRVAASANDAEQNSAGTVTLTGTSPLELARVSNANNIVGLRFTGLNIPQGATITSATVQFTAAATPGSNTVNVFIDGELSTNAAAFTATNNNISSRTKTSAANQVNWANIPTWTANTANAASTTPSLTNIVQQIVNQAGWTTSSPLVLIFTNNATTSSNSRNGQDFDTSAANAPLLTVTYTCPTPSIQPNRSYEIRIPNATGGSKQAALGANVLTTANTDPSANGDARDSDAALSGVNAVIALTTGAYGANNHTYDFGFTTATATFSVGNRLFYDTNNNGVFDFASGEVHIPGVTVDLLNSGGTQIQTTTTDANGYYRFDGIAAGTDYRVRIRGTNFSGLLSGYQSSTGATVGTDRRDNGIDPAANNPTLNHVLSAPFTMGFTQPIAEPDVTTGNPATDRGAHAAAGDVTDNLLVDFGFYRGQIGNLVFEDVNNDGDFDSGGATPDVGLAGALVALYQSDGTTIVPVGQDGILGTADDNSVPANQFTTAAGGAYLFRGLLPGSYVIKVTPPTGYQSTVDVANTNNPNSGTDHDDNGPGTGTGQVTSGVLTLVAGSTANGATFSNSNGQTENITADFGFRPSAPSAVKMAEFTATVQSGSGLGRNQRRGQSGVLLQWSTSFEVDNLGFNVYRDDNGQRVLLNRGLIAGSALQVGEGVQLRSGTSYEWADARGTTGAMYWLEEVDLNGERTWHGPVFANPASSNANSMRRAIAGRTLLVEELNGLAPETTQTEWAESPESSSSVTEEAPDTAEAHLLTARVNPNEPVWTLPGQRAVKLAIRKAGWYRVTAAELAALGFDTTNLNLNALSLVADGQPVALKVVRTKNDLSAIEFYGRGVDLPSTDTRIYWLSANGTNVVAMDSAVPRQPATPSVNSFVTTVERKDRLIYFSSLLNQEAENWFGAVVSPTGTTQTLTTRFAEIQPSAFVELEVKLQGVTNQTHSVKVEANGQLAGSMLFTARENFSQKFTIPANWLRDGDNEIRLTGTMGSADYSLVDSLRLRYARRYQTDNDVLTFTLASGQVARVTGFTTPNIRLLQLASGTRMQPRELEIKAQPITGGGYGFTLMGDGRAYLAVADSKLERPASLKLNQPSNWRAYSNEADFLIVTHGLFKASADQLAQARATQGWRPVVVDVEDAYDEFAFGTRTPHAIRALIEHAQTKWATKLRAVLLIGSGHYDPRNYSGKATEDFIPIKLMDTTLLESVSENWFTDLNNDTMSDIPLGRLPVRSAEQAAGVVAKLLETKPEPAWRGALLVSDYTANGIDFPGMSRQIAASLPAGMAQQFIDRKDGTAADLRAAIIQSINTNKPQIVNWSGHGSTDRWTGEGLLTLTEGRTLTNNAPALWVMMTCLNGYFINPTPVSLSEAVLLNPSGGAIAVVASSTMSVPQPQFVLNQAFYSHLFGGGKTVGEALQAAKQASNHWEIRQTYVLLGDPTLRLSLSK